MSDIIYTPPASSGGVQNPTTDFIPLNNGTSSFVDSNIRNTKGNGNLLTLDIDNLNDYFGLGSNRYDYTGVNYNFNSVGNLEYIYFGNAANSCSLEFLLDWNTFTNSYAFLQANTTGLYIDDTKFLTKKGGVGGSDIGLLLDFTSKIYNIGDWIGLNNISYLSVDDDNALVLLSTKGTTSFLVDGTSDKLTFTTKYLNFVGATLQSGSASGNSGQHLVITLNGTAYKIQLLNP